MKAEGNLLHFYIIFNLQLDEVAWARYTRPDSFPVTQFLILPASSKGYALFSKEIPFAQIAICMFMSKMYIHS
jgi:hypothetical protein